MKERLPASRKGGVGPRRLRTSESAVTTAGQPEKKRRFTLPSAYTILFALIVMAAIATWIIPAGTYDLNDAGEPRPGTYHEVDSKPSRILEEVLDSQWVVSPKTLPQHRIEGGREEAFEAL